ncbi:MAG: tRNA (adenosine(37)-N6)-threonylcarbamoyltransferase complex dimerization subunit type 1 TsaB [Eubacteriales bacterium]|nr:tRNA (adenosine(37)-N6)-threonylcarbamoyltransferase complex dimerization subunit type 1 TsaB [Eubacteriales bacterium]
MKILALETSAKSVSVAVWEDDKVLGSAYQNTGLTHSRTLMPLLDGMLTNSELTLNDMDLIAVAAGPGSFTGLRIGVSAAKGLAWAQDLPCCGVSTLDAMAQNVRHMDGCTVICAMDARRQQVYNALFHVHNGALERMSPDRAISLEELVAEIKNDGNDKIIVGDGARLCYTYLSEQGIACRMAPPPLIMQNAVGVAQVAREMAQRGETVSAHELVPVYLRLSQAERERLAKGLKITLD